MIATVVHVWVKPEFRDAFIEASRINHINSIEEPGNLRFDILNDANDPNKFTFYEVYESRENILAHKETNHYLTWRDTVSEMMAKPREGVSHTVISPTDRALW